MLNRAALYTSWEEDLKYTKDREEDLKVSKNIS